MEGENIEPYGLREGIRIQMRGKAHTERRNRRKRLEEV
jgi:hypothetical protein